MGAVLRTYGAKIIPARDEIMLQPVYPDAKKAVGGGVMEWNLDHSSHPSKVPYPGSPEPFASNKGVYWPMQSAALFPVKGCLLVVCGLDRRSVAAIVRSHQDCFHAATIAYSARSGSLRTLAGFSAPLVVWNNRREAGTPFSGLEPLGTEVDGMRVLRWYGVPVKRDPHGPCCGNYLARLAAMHGLEVPEPATGAAHAEEEDQS